MNFAENSRLIETNWPFVCLDRATRCQQALCQAHLPIRN